MGHSILTAVVDREKAKPSVVLRASACRFVVVEDDVLLCDCIANVLRQSFAPAALHTFRNGRDALRHIAEQPFDLLFTDLGLPDLDGRQIIRQAASPTRASWC